MLWVFKLNTVNLSLDEVSLFSNCDVSIYDEWVKIARSSDVSLRFPKKMVQILFSTAPPKLRNTLSSNASALFSSGMREIYFIVSTTTTLSGACDCIG